MEKSQTESRTSFPENPEFLWERFEKTGSVKDYLRYSKKIEAVEKLVPLDLPS